MLRLTSKGYITSFSITFEFLLHSVVFNNFWWRCKEAKDAARDWNVGTREGTNIARNYVSYRGVSRNIRPRRKHAPVYFMFLTFCGGAVAATIWNVFVIWLLQVQPWRWRRGNERRHARKVCQRVSRRMTLCRANLRHRYPLRHEYFRKGISYRLPPIFLLFPLHLNFHPFRCLILFRSRLSASKRSIQCIVQTHFTPVHFARHVVRSP